MKRDEEDLIRQRQKGRAIVMAVLLGGFVLLVFAITIVKIKAGIAAR
ncbi:hypothetical protein [Sphingomonas lycopersici]|uniref:Cytochrome C oxidase assembly protein n=1 Tax=Sphingomonas lycopersici TaxID=2951807 RepID=A0AA42CQJ3_9SPHN|nr:hypothetical protein [Sphingomonas lycopersici]MCW6534992.1 hypothetical protein [Sphingomonas lycopersici]